MADHLLLATGDDLLLTDGVSFLLLQSASTPSGPTYDVPGPSAAPHAQDAPVPLAAYMPESHGADAPGIGYDPATQYRSP